LRDSMTRHLARRPYTCRQCRWVRLIQNLFDQLASP